MRYAIYFTPPRDHALTRAAVSWLGRDAFGGEPSAPEAVGDLTAEEIAAYAASARRYGFHATLKAPFALAEGMSADGLDAALGQFAQNTPPVTIERLVLAQLDGFFALVPGKANPALQALAGAVVEAFEPFRAPLSVADLARRKPEALSPTELGNLPRWGYPYVFDTFRFHMTLTGRAKGDEAARLRAALEARFAGLLDAPVAVDGLALFVEPQPGADFVVRSYYRLGG